MKPILFYVGAFPIRAYGLLLLLGMLAGFLALRRAWGESALRPGAIYRFCAGAIVSSLVGGRLGYVLLHAAEYAAEPARLLHFWQEGGEVAWGAIGALLAWSWAYALRAGVAPSAFFDLLTLPATLGEGIMRWGCLLNGCCYGREVAGFPGLYLPDLNGHWTWRYPTQILYSAVGLGLFTLFWTGRQRTPFAGFLALTYLILYPASRLAIGALRGDYQTVEARTLSLGLDLALLVLGLGLMAWRVGQERRCREEGW